MLPVRTPPRPWWVIALAALGYAGYFKSNPTLAWLPVDLTVTSAAIVALVVLLGYLGRHGDWKSTGGVAAVFLVLSAGIAFAPALGKPLVLFSVTLLCALAPCVLLVDSRAQRWWLRANIACAALMIGTALVFPDTYVWKVYGRLSVEGGVTIAVGRVIAAGAVAAAVLALTSRRSRRRVLLIIAAVAGAGAVVAVGSRGPLIAMVTAVAGVLIFARSLSGRRTTAAGVLLIAGAMTVWLVARANTGGGDRIAAFLSGEGDDSRDQLAGAALAQIPTHPLGIGWGSFGNYGFSAGGVPLTYPHNMLLETTLEGGWLAGLAVTAIIVAALIAYRRDSATPTGAALFGLGIFWIVVAQTSSDINGNRMTWIAIALGLVLGRKHAHNVPAPEPSLIP